MINKTIHYCWFGKNEKPLSVLKCIDSWKKYLPDYRIVEWNEENFDISDSIPYVRQAYDNKKWAFVTDYVRLKVLADYGGIYLDTDVEVFKSFDPLLSERCFLGFESNDYLCTAVIGCEPRNGFICQFLESYNSRSFVKDDGTIDTDTTNVVSMTNLLLNEGLIQNGKYQKLNGITIFPQFFFASNDIINIIHKYDSRIYSYHHCQASWYVNSRNGSFWNLLRHYIVGKLRNVIGTDRLYSLKLFV